ncbi:receptor-like protein 12 [Canna indica]|uniref:Receptor-like protein 12 n=1 Tax=Canna indica TaxID=4628 RepID=A0AAQ3KUP6_9LILI|nr:receptor-like protein 12 [Canna indica]
MSLPHHHHNHHHHHHVLLLVHLLLLYSLTPFFGELIAVAAAAACLPEESSALIQLKNGFSITSSLTSWQPGSDCCGWYGVMCDNSTSRVTALNLSGLSLSGKLDHALFNLTSVTSLSLAYNLFHNIYLLDLPFSRLANLTRLNLSNAGFIGQIPADVGRLKKLVSLDLSTFYLNELPSSSLKLHDPNFATVISNLSNLKELVLDGVNISADGHEWCQAVSVSTPGLEVLSLAGCSLTGPIHSSLSSLPSLSILRLDQNNLNSIFPDFFGNFSSLTVLRLSSCGLQGSVPESLFQLRNLKALDISTNEMLSGRLPQFPANSVLESLVLSDTNFSGPLPESIGYLKALSRLQLLNCSFSGLIPLSITNLTQMVRLDLSFNSFSGEIPPIGTWSKITEVTLSYNNLTGGIHSSFGQEFLNITKIDLRNNSLNGSIPASLFTLPSLQVLQLSQNMFSGQLEEFLSASPSLVTVDLSNNKLEGPIPTSLFDLSGLKVLSLASNKFSGTLQIDRFWRLRNLSSLDLSSNKLRIRDGDNGSLYGSFPKFSTLKLVSCNLEKIPAFLQNQDRISSLDLSNNRISAGIPRWIWSIGNGNLIYLNLSFNLFTSVEGSPPNLSTVSSMILDLQHNKLQGPIPFPPPNTIVLDYSSNNFTSTIPANLSIYLNYTVFLSFANNQLAGEIPPSICNAGFLQVLDLSNNNLNGSIPSCLMEGNTDLAVLNLRGNQFHGKLPENVGERCVLQTINLNKNLLEGKLPRSFTKCSLLEVLDLGSNRIQDSFPYWLGNLSELRVLVLKSNRFYGTVVHPPGRSKERNFTFSKLQIFDLSSNNFTGNLPQLWFTNLKAMMFNSADGQQTVGYAYLRFSESSYYQNTVSIASKGQIMTLSKVLTTYTVIDFSSNLFDGSIPKVIGKLNFLRVLNISHNFLTGGVPPQLGNMSQLESLDLSVNQLSGEIPEELASLTFLSVLNLSSNKLAGRIPQAHQFLTFSNVSFEGNEGLCGAPLSKQCNEQTTSTNSVSSEPSVVLNWQCIFVGLGFGGGMAIVVVPLMIWSEGKRWYNKRVDQMLDAIVPRWPCETCGDVKVAAEHVCCDSVEIEDEDRRFCLFCTRLEFHAGQAIIHHEECCCGKLIEES